MFLTKGMGKKKRFDVVEEEDCHFKSVSYRLHSDIFAYSSSI